MQANARMGQILLMIGIDIYNVGEGLSDIAERLVPQFKKKKEEVMRQLEEQLEPLQTQITSGERLQEQLSQAFERVVSGGPSAVQAAREVIASLSPTDVQGQEDQLRQMIEHLAKIAGVEIQPKSPYQQAKGMA